MIIYRVICSKCRRTLVFLSPMPAGMRADCPCGHTGKVDFEEYSDRTAEDLKKLQLSLDDQEPYTVLRPGMQTLVESLDPAIRVALLELTTGDRSGQILGKVRQLREALQLDLVSHPNGAWINQAREAAKQYIGALS